jgi:hypothetical protein
VLLTKGKQLLIRKYSNYEKVNLQITIWIEKELVRNLETRDSTQLKNNAWEKDTSRTTFSIQHIYSFKRYSCEFRREKLKASASTPYAAPRTRMAFNLLLYAGRKHWDGSWVKCSVIYMLFQLFIYFYISDMNRYAN